MSTPVPEHLVLGLDIGGTWTRALLATTTGRRVAAGRAAGANPAAHGAPVAAGRIAAALADALQDTDPGTVAGCVVGLAGASQYAADPATARAIERVWQAAGLTCPIRVTSDVAVAFAAGTAQPAGAVLLAGTGAVAAQLHDREPVRLHGGYGWLLGDDGSGFWIGRQAVRATLAVLDGQAPMSPLAELVLARYFAGTDTGGATGPEHAGVDRPRRRPAAALIREVNRRPAISLAGLAPLVMQAHASGDGTAVTIVTEAADLLLTTFAQAHPVTAAAPAVPGPVVPGPVVLGGGLLATPTPVRDLVAAGLRDAWPHAQLRIALDGAAAAAWLAALALLGDGAAAEDLHARLVSPATATAAAGTISSG